MNYQKTETYINDIPKFSSKNTMEDTRLFLKHLGNPDQSVKIIHVAGTNGKGSTCAYMTAILNRMGYQVGTFVSPHLVTTRERFLINGEMIAEDTFVNAFMTVKHGLETMPEVLQKKGYHPSFFEYLFFMGMVIFSKEKLDYVILETGLGGRLDATNAVLNKCVCVITSIGYDHMEYLGETLSEIAFEKAGIIVSGVPVVYPQKQTEVDQVIKERIKAVKAVDKCVETHHLKGISILPAGIDFSYYSLYYNYVGMHLRQKALYQVENCCLALRAIECLFESNKEEITPAVLQDGIASMNWQARMEEIMPHIYLDGAHNIDGIRALVESIRGFSEARSNTDTRRILLFSVVKDKQYKQVIKALVEANLFTEYHLVELQGYRALPLAELENSFLEASVAFQSHKTLKEALAQMKEEAQLANTDVFIVGSLYLAGEVKTCLLEE